MNLRDIQAALKQEGLDGWLFFDHHRRDPISYRVLDFTPGSMVTRRWFYFIPAVGDPRGLAHKIEAHTLQDLPGTIRLYASWSELVNQLKWLVATAGDHPKIAMQYSPNCAIPYVAMVDAGTVELVRSLGATIETSANLIQMFESVWTAEQLQQHLEAGRRVDRTRAAAFQLIGERLRSQQAITEFEVQQFILQTFKDNGLFTDHGPDVAVNENASNPHYNPTRESSAQIRTGDLVLIDLWAKLTDPNAVYYDVTWVGFAGGEVPEKIQQVFYTVRDARNRAIARVRDAVSAKEPLQGFQVDDAARSFIEAAGYGEYFFHRTGHNIGTDVHGTGANMDNLETHDERRVIPWTCFSIEPGIYLPEFGIRSEVNMFVGPEKAMVTGEIQEEFVMI